MGWEAWFTLFVLVVVLIALVREWGPTDMVLMAGAVAVTVAGVITPKDLFAGFSNEGMLTVAALFVVAAGVRETGALDIIGRFMMGGARTETAAMLRMSPQVATLSAFLNNTAVVAMLLPVVTDWCRKHNVSPSRLLLPLSHITVLGGCVTLVGTSTNLVVNGLMARAVVADPSHATDLKPLWLFELAMVGIPCALAGTAYMLTIGRKLMPDRKDMLESFDAQRRDYLVNVRVEPDCVLIGKQIEEAGLRRLPGLFLTEIRRGNRMIAPVGPNETVQPGDRLTFTGAVSTIVDLERIRGLVAVSEDEPASRDHERDYVEVVISVSSPLCGQSIRDCNFRARFNAAVLAVHRGGERLLGRVGDITLRAGDALLIQAGPHFLAAHRNSPDFVLVSQMQDTRPVRHDRALISMVLLLVFIVLLATEWLAAPVAAFLISGLMIVSRCISPAAARRDVRWDVLIAIAASFALGAALEKSGAATELAKWMVGAAGPFGPIAVLAAVYFVSMLLTELITNNAAAVLVFPIAIEVAEQLGVPARPMIMAITFAASFGFATPMGYQTNLMIYGPGGYRFLDFVRVGVPLDLICMAVAVTLIPFVWPLG